MKRILSRVAIGGALIGAGWIAGNAQTRVGDFEIRIDAPAGRTHVECLRGCGLIGARDVQNPRAGQMRRYEYECTSLSRCEASIVGFLRR